MHFVTILVGVFLGVFAMDAEKEFFAAVAAALIASLLFRLGAARSKIDRLSRRIDRIEQRQASAMPARPQTVDTPQPATTPGAPATATAGAAACNRPRAGCSGSCLQKADRASARRRNSA